MMHNERTTRLQTISAASGRNGFLLSVVVVRQAAAL